MWVEARAEVESDAEEDAVTAAATARVVMETEAVARARSAWRERETFDADAEQAAVALRRVLARESEGDGDAVSEGYRVTFRDGAVRAFVRKADARAVRRFVGGGFGSSRDVARRRDSGFVRHATARGRRRVRSERGVRTSVGW